MSVLCLALAVMFGIIDATRSVGASDVIFTSVADSWNSFHNDSFLTVMNWADQSAPSFVNDPILVTLFQLPTFVVFAVLSFLLYILGYRRRRRPGYFLEN